MRVDDLKQRIDELADMMDEFGLDRARLKGGDWVIEFSRRPRRPPMPPMPPMPPGLQPEQPPTPREEAPAKEPPKGVPVTSPMTGIYYSTPSPSAPDFVKVGDQVAEGQVIGLIEAMKVFNELTAPNAGVVTHICLENGQIVQPGDPIIYIL